MSARTTFAADAPPQPTAVPSLVDAMLRPETYPHPADRLRLLETHISWIALAGEYAYKFKKPVDFGFLDFSTFERRANDCAAEVRLNRRLCPDVYLGVVDLVERGGSFHIGGPGRRVEPAVCMRRLPDEGMLPALLARDAVQPSLLQQIAGRLARFHTRAPTGPGVDELGGLASVQLKWAENFEQMAPFIDRTISTASQVAIDAYVRRFLATHATLFDRRVAAGRIRDGHGDLHAASICVEGRRLHLFDCLEFSERYRCSDVAAEVAFLAMDLDHFGRADLSAAFVDTYVRHSSDDELRQLLDFYKCYRAYVRGKVLSLRLDELDRDPAHASTFVDEARSYFELAHSYTAEPRHPTLFVTVGLPASGKTSLACALAGRLALVRLSSDVVRKELVGMKSTERRLDAFQQGLYSPQMSRRTYAALRRRARRWLRRDHSVVLDATFGQPRERAAVRRLAAALGVGCVVLYCRADDTTIRARLASRATDVDTPSDARLELWPALRAAFVEPSEIPDLIEVDLTKPLAEAVEGALERIRTRITPSISNV
ncbi:MAG: AAA family ATPase [Chloroflexi bacterium]|nr:AAA family ATPase [Chloroflexota bacterium]